MDKEKVIIGVLIVLLIGVGIFAVMNMTKVKSLQNENAVLVDDKNKLGADNEQLMRDKEAIVDEKNNLMSELDMLKDDVFQLKKSCITENACKGHFPGIRWTCNNVGDAITGDMASHVCVCDDLCNLTATFVKTINP
jgi:hypothetical protein